MAPSLVVRAAFFCADAMPRLRSTTNASSISPFVSWRALRQSPMGAPDFSRSSFTNFASIFSLTVILSSFSFPNSIWFDLILTEAHSREAQSAPPQVCNEKAWHLLLAATLSVRHALAREEG